MSQPVPWLLRMNPAAALFHPATRALSVLVVLVSFVFPVSGLGFDLCVFHATTGLPCPGCGLTRGLSALSQGQFFAALQLHPFVFLLWPTFALVSLSNLFPRRWREAIVDTLQKSQWAAAAYSLALLGFLSFGLVRLVVFGVRGRAFP
jgi:hypothetical protein